MPEPITPERMAEIMAWHKDCECGCAEVAAEVERLARERDRAYEELRQGWPKMAHDANRAAIEAMNERDAARAEVKRLRAQVAAVEEAWLSNYVEENGTMTWGLIESMRAALELTDEAEHV
jgi:hypothetical protein